MTLHPERRRLVVFGTYDSSAHPRVTVIVDGLRAHGVEVEECNVPLGLDTAARVNLLRKPWTTPALGARIVNRWVRLWRLSRQVAPADAVLVPYMGHFDVHLARRRFRSTPIVLDHLVSGRDTARDRGVSSPLRDRVLSTIDAAALRVADAVLVDTDEHRDFLPEWAREKAIVMLVGASDGWAAPPRPSYAEGRPLRVIFFGLFTPLQGTITIGEALAELADEPAVEVTMVGDGQDLGAAKQAAAGSRNVRWVGMVAPEDLPQLVAAHDVCLGIFADNSKGTRVVPNKVYQGLRAGCAIVTSDTAPQRRILGDLAVYVRPGDPGALASALRELAADPARVSRLQEASRAASDRFGPARVVGDLAAWLSRTNSVQARSAVAHDGRS